MPNPLVGLFVGALVERPARRMGPAALVARLEAGRAGVPALLEGAGDAAAVKQLRHVIGIERWGQRRLRVALGDVAYQRDEHQAYLPSEAETRAQLLERFDAVRVETVDLARRLVAEARLGEKVEHNALGPVTALGWLRYLQMHGEWEARRARSIKTS